MRTCVDAWTNWLPWPGSAGSLEERGPSMNCSKIIRDETVRATSADCGSILFLDAETAVTDPRRAAIRGLRVRPRAERPGTPVA